MASFPAAAYLVHLLLQIPLKEALKPQDALVRNTKNHRESSLKQSYQPSPMMMMMMTALDSIDI